MRLRYQDTKRVAGWDVLPKGAIHDPDHQIHANLETYLTALGRPTNHLRRPGWPKPTEGEQ